MTSRRAPSVQIDAFGDGEAAAAAKLPWIACPRTDGERRRDWLHGWIRGAFGDAMSRQHVSGAELRDKYLAMFPVKPMRARARWTDAEWEFVEVARWRWRGPSPR